MSDQAKYDTCGECEHRRFEHYYNGTECGVNGCECAAFSDAARGSVPGESEAPSERETAISDGVPYVARERLIDGARNKRAETREITDGADRGGTLRDRIAGAGRARHVPPPEGVVGAGSSSRRLGAEAMPAITLTVPMPENLANTSQRGWRGLHARKVKYLAALDALQGAGLIPAPPKRAFAKARIRATMYLGAPMDAGNAMHRCEKWPCDWLKTRGYIVDDRASCLEWEGLPSQVVKRNQNYRIEITLTAI